MSADTFVSALLIITGVVAAGILINAVYPVIWSSASTFSSSAHETDTRMRTDIKIVTTHASAATDIGKVWIKNIGSNPIGIAEIESADVFIGPKGDFYRLSWDEKPINTAPQDPVANYWDGSLYDNNNNNIWDTGETLVITGHSSKALTSGEYVYFQVVLPNGVYRSAEFTAVD